ncbi:unnamed protein product [Angiostrongylus costaricensis]|uniref:DUF1308 domain-containing protein n=1 Tax=Angiostrongylus costaricensis TaxID=334426 RepID=A0A0R3Q139_ANGCS|nr:unnamed protein product [Angiostrongylus costaricensis]
MQIAIGTIAKIPEDFMELLMENDGDGGHMPASTVKSPQLPPVNLDVSAVFVLISNLTHEHGTDHMFDSTLLTQQAEMEKRNPARTQLLSQIEGRELIICRTAYDSVRDILSTVGGDSEKKRMEELFKNVRLVDDAVSERTSILKHSDRINQRSIVSWFCIVFILISTCGTQLFLEGIEEPSISNILTRCKKAW